MPAWGLVLQGVWAAALVLPRTYNPATGAYGNLYSNLLDYVDLGGADLLHPDHRRRVPAARRVPTPTAVPRVRLPVVPALYIVGARDDPARAVRVSSVDDLAGAGDRAARRAGVPLLVDGESIAACRLPGATWRGPPAMRATFTRTLVQQPRRMAGQ